MAEIDQKIASCEAVLARLSVGSPDRPRHRTGKGHTSRVRAAGRLAWTEGSACSMRRLRARPWGCPSGRCTWLNSRACYPSGTQR